MSLGINIDRNGETGQKLLPNIDLYFFRLPLKRHFQKAKAAASAWQSIVGLRPLACAAASVLFG